MLLAFLSYFDLFQTPIKFYFNGRSKLYSSFGILISFSLYGFLLFSFINSDLFKKEQPIITTQSLQMAKAEPIHFDSNIILTFALVDFRGNRYWDPTYFTIVARYYTSTTNFIEKELKSCAVEANNKNERMGTNFNNTMCLLNDTFTLEGSIDDSVLKYLSLNVLPCNNQTSNNTCKSVEEINTYITTYPLAKYFAVRYHNVKTDLNNYENPFQWNSDIETQYLDNKIQRNWYLYFKNAEIETDDGWFSSSKHSLSDIMLDNKITDFRLRAKDSDSYFIIAFFASKQKYISSRRYKKLPEVLAEISGMAQFFITIFGFLTRFVLYLGALNKIMNKLYVFPKVEKKKKRSKKVLLKDKKKKSKKQETKADSLKSPNINNDNTKNIETTIINDKKNENSVNNNILFDTQENLCEITFTKKPNIQEDTRKKNNVFIEIIENKSCDLPKESLLENFNHLQPKILIDDPIVSERFSIEKENELEKQKIKIVDNFPNNPLDIISKPVNDQKLVFSSEISRSLPENLQNVSPVIANPPLAKNLKKSLFSTIIDKSRKFSQKFSNKSLSKLQKSQENQNFKVTIFDYFQYFWCKFLGIFSNKKLSEFHEIIEQAEITYVKDIDLMNLIQKNHDLEKLKLLILNEDQLVLFNFLSKPIINPSNNKTIWAGVQDSSKKITDLIKKQTSAGNFLDDSYQRVLKNEENNEINRRLIQFLDTEIKKLK